jgi:hypothetical protein
MKSPRCGSRPHLPGIHRFSLRVSKLFSREPKATEQPDKPEYLCLLGF